LAFTPRGGRIPGGDEREEGLKDKDRERVKKSSCNSGKKGEKAGKLRKGKRSKRGKRLRGGRGRRIGGWKKRKPDHYPKWQLRKGKT